MAHPPGVPPRPRPRSAGRERRREAVLAYIFLAPACLVLAVFTLYPLGATLVGSLHRGWGGPRSTFVGLENFDRALGGTEFWHSLLVTVYYFVGTAPVGIGLSFLIAVLLHREMRARGFYRAMYFLPYVTSTIAAASVFLWIFGLSERSVANSLLRWLGLPRQHWTSEPRGVLEMTAHYLGFEQFPSWAGGPSLALLCVMLFAIWHMLGFNIVVFLAGLSAIPKELYEAADVDGASWRQKTLHVTLPLLSPTIFFLLLISVIRSFQSFNDIFMLAPIERTRSACNVVLLIYSKMVESSDFGYASALSFLLFLIILSLTLLQIRLFERKVHYQ